MPPSKSSTSSNKNLQKKQQKIIEDKTFGLKNKKGKKVQNIVKQVENQVKSNPAYKDMQVQNEKKKKAKEEEERKLREIEMLMKPVVLGKKDTVTTGASTDKAKKAPCPYFKVGKCNKGVKCKLSHNPEDATENGKINPFVDYRENVETIGTEQSHVDISQMTQEELEKLIEQKHGSSNRTEIVCKFFLEAVEKNLFGWFWQCPNGGNKCIYRHALPPGYVLKRDRIKPKRADEISIEEFIETERFKLGDNLTPVTFETFTVWKKRKLAEKKQLLQEQMDQKQKEMSQRNADESYASSHGSKVLITGRDLFSFDASLYNESAGDPTATSEENAEIINILNDDDETEADSAGDVGPIADLNNVEQFLSQKKQVADYKCTVASSLNPKLREQAYIRSIEGADEVDDEEENKGISELSTQTPHSEINLKVADDVIELVGDMSLFEMK